jgi:chromosome segregation ATPase
MAIFIAIFELVIFIAIGGWLYQSREKLKQNIISTENLARELTKENEIKRLALEEQTEKSAKLSNKFDNINRRLSELENQNEKLQEKIKEKEKIEVTYKNLLNQKEIEIEGLRTKYINELKNHETKLREKIEGEMGGDYQRELVNLKEQYTKSLNKQEEILGKKDDKIELLENKIDDLEKRLTEMESAHKENQIEIKKKQNYVGNLEGKLHEAREEIERIQQSSLRRSYLYNEAIPNSMRSSLNRFSFDEETDTTTETVEATLLKESLVSEVKKLLVDLREML